MATTDSKLEVSVTPSQPANEETIAVFHLERPTANIQQVQFSTIIARPEDYAFRGKSDSDPFSKSALGSLMESVKSYGGINTPVLVRDNGNGTVLLCDGHRRYYATKHLIAEGVSGFTREMVVPANVLGQGTGELTTITMSIAGNIEREPLSFDGRLDATLKLHRLGMPKRDIAKVMHVSETVVDRDLLLAGDDIMRRHIANHLITASNAAGLLGVAAAHGRRSLLTQFFDAWVKTATEQLQAEDKARADRDEQPLTGAKRWLQNRMPPELVPAWKEALVQGSASAMPASLRFKAMVQRDGGRPRVVIDGLSKDIEELSAADIGKIVRRCLDLAEELEPVLKLKVAEAERGSTASTKDRRPSRGLQYLQQLGVAALVGEDDAAEPAKDAPEEEEPTSDQAGDSQDDDGQPIDGQGGAIAAAEDVQALDSGQPPVPIEDDANSAQGVDDQSAGTEASSVSDPKVDRDGPPAHTGSVQGVTAPPENEQAKSTGQPGDVQRPHSAEPPPKGHAKPRP